MGGGGRRAWRRLGLGCRVGVEVRGSWVPWSGEGLCPLLRYCLRVWATIRTFRQSYNCIWECGFIFFHCQLKEIATNRKPTIPEASPFTLLGTPDMFPFSQEMSSDEAALIPPSWLSGRRRDSQGRALFPRRPGSAWLRKGSPWGWQSPRPPFPSFSQNPGFVLSQATYFLPAGPHFPVSPRPPLGASTTLPLAGTGSEGLDC